MFKNIIFFLIVIMPGGAYTHEAENIPHMRSFLTNIRWYIQHVIEDVELLGCPVSAQEYVSGDIAPYIAIGTPDRYFANIVLQSNCDIRLTVNNSIADIPVPGFVKAKKILLKSYTVDGEYYWECKTDIDVNTSFQGAATTTVNAPSIISYFSDNLYVGNCVYVATPF